MITLIQKPDHIADQGLVRKFEFLSYQNDENTLRKENQTQFILFLG